MQDTSRNRNPANLEKATKLFESLCEMAKLDIESVVEVVHNGTTYTLNLNENNFKKATKNDVTLLKKERFIDELTQLNDIEIDHFLKKCEESIRKPYKTEEAAMEGLNPNETDTRIEIITDPQEGQRIRLIAIRNEKQLEREEAIENDRVEGAISREEISEDEKEAGQNLDNIISGHEETTHREALENPMSEEEIQKWEEEYQEEFDSHTRNVNF